MNFRKTFFAFGLLASLSAAPSHAAPPNIIFILTDDQGWGDVGVLFQNGRDSMIIFQGFIELVVANVGMALAEAEQNGSAGGSADRRGAIVLHEEHAFVGHAVPVGRLEGGFAGRALILPELADVAVTEIIHQDEDDVGFPVQPDV